MSSSRTTHMRLGLVGSALAFVAVSAAAANLSVSFVQPENYADAGYSHSLATERDRAEVLRDVEQHLQQLAERRLPPGESLRIEILDIDLAGRFEPLRLRNGADVRIVSDSTWPRIRLRYTLAQGDRVVARAEEQIADMNFLAPGNRYPSADRLRYEKAMLDDWFEKRIVGRR